MRTGNTVVDASAQGAFLSGGGNTTKVLAGVLLTAGADAATVIVRETDGSGRKLCQLAVGAGQSIESQIPVTYVGNVHVTLTGTAPFCFLYQP